MPDQQTWETVPGFDREFKKLPPHVIAALRDVMERREYGLNHLLPREYKHLRGDLWELRKSLNGNEYRVLYAEVQDHRVLLALAAATKKARRIRPEIEVAEDRLQEYRRLEP